MNSQQWRKATWGIVAWSALVLLFIVVRVMQVATKSCSDFDESGDCFNIAVNGKGAVALSQAAVGIVIWIVGFSVLAVIWFMTREKVRACPHCGENVAKGLTACPTCGYDFAQWNPAAGSATGAALAGGVAPTPAAVASTPPEGWYDDAARPGRKRWWDGTAWGIRDDEDTSLASVTPPADSGGDNGAPIAPESQTQALTAEHADDAEIAIAIAEPTPETPEEPAATATAIALDSEAAAADAAPTAPEPDSASPMARFCENCGAERRPGGRFCTSCGHA